MTIAPESRPTWKARMKAVSKSLKREIAVYQAVLAHPRTPKAARILLSMAIADALMPFDLIPDFIPILGQLDDVVIIPGLVLLALRQIPVSVLEECRQKIVMQEGNMPEGRQTK